MIPPQPSKPQVRRRIPLVPLLVLVLLPVSYLLSTRILHTKSPGSASSLSTAARSAPSSSAHDEPSSPLNPSNLTARISESAPAACSRLLADALAFDPKCTRTDPTSLACDGDNGAGSGAATFLGQYGQDHYMYTRHFSRLNRPGVYVDVAANDATHLSNTAVFDKCLGWRGVCIEPNPEYHEALKSNRSCALYAGCVSARNGDEVDFVFNGGFSGVRDRMKFPPSKRQEGELAGAATLTCERLASVLARESVDHVDYLSIDVEGSEMQVLGGIDWDKVRIDVISVEVNKRTVVDVTQILEKDGFVRHMPDRAADPKGTGLLVEDAIFVHRDVEFGAPR